MIPLIVDSFAGGGGASTGIEMALGRSPDIAINHNAAALAMHEANHPDTLHLSKNIWQVDPLEAVGNRPVGLAWFSPDCKHFSKAKGGKPVKRNIRDLAWTVVLWAKRARPAVIFLENVEEFQTWGPLIENDKGEFVPDPARRGETFKRWVAALKRCGYKVAWRELVAADYGAPTTRKRLFLIARRDGTPIVWPAPTHGKPGDPDVIAGRKLPWRTAAEIIDWSLPCPSIFETSAEIMAKHGVRAVRPLAPATMARVARGTKRYVLDAAEPYIVKFQTGSTGSPIGAPLPTVTANSFLKRPGGGAPIGLVVPSISPLTHQGSERKHSVEDPLRTITTAHRGEMAMVAPVLTAAHQGGSLRGADEPMRTIAASDKDQHAIIAPTLVNVANSKTTGRGPNTWSPQEPLRTITGSGGAAIAATFLGQHNNDTRRIGGVNPGREADRPLSTVTACGTQQSVVATFLAQHNTGEVGHHPEKPLSTIVQKGCTQGVVAAHLQNMRGSDRRDAPVTDPARTITAGGGHASLVAAFMTKYYGEGGMDQDVADPLHTLTTKARMGLVTVEIGGEPYVITDIGLRMLTPRKLFLAQGFPPEYQIDGIVLDGRVLTKSDQISCVGNSVCPPLAAALVAANCAHLSAIPAMEAAE